MIYRAALEIEVDGDCVDDLYDVVDEIEYMDDVAIINFSPFSNNPPDYPEEV